MLRSFLVAICALGLGCAASTPTPSPPPSAAAPPAAKKEAFVQSWKSLSLSTPVRFSAPTKVGLDAVALLHPAAAKLADATFSITLVELSAAMQKEMGLDEAGLLDYVKTTFLGTSLPATGHKERTILGRTSKGALLAQTIPRPSRIELHLVPLAGGARLALAFRHDEAMPAAEVAAIVEGVCASLAARGR